MFPLQVEIDFILPYYTSTLWNTIECCRGFEDMKDEISSSLKASNIFGLIFTECTTFGSKI